MRESGGPGKREKNVSKEDNRSGESGDWVGKDLNVCQSKSRPSISQQ